MDLPRTLASMQRSNRHRLLLSSGPSYCVSQHLSMFFLVPILQRSSSPSDSCHYLVILSTLLFPFRFVSLSPRPVAHNSFLGPHTHCKARYGVHHTILLYLVFSTSYLTVY